MNCASTYKNIENTKYVGASSAGGAIVLLLLLRQERIQAKKKLKVFMRLFIASDALRSR